MKNKFKLVAGVGVMIIVLLGVYYQFVVNATGTNGIQYIEPDDQYESFSSLLQHPDLKGKVIYVDYWHTGCGPCLQEFQHMPEVKEHFKDRTDLAFLYLGKDRSMPGEKFRWKKMIEKKQLRGQHFFMTNEKYDKIWSETVSDTSLMKIFPHYLIVSREGKIVNHNAPRPSDEALIETLTTILTD